MNTKGWLDWIEANTWGFDGDPNLDAVRVKDLKGLIKTHVILSIRDAKLLLSFCPTEADKIPKGLSPEFYHTLSYDKEHEVVSRVDEIKAMIEAFNE